MRLSPVDYVPLQDATSTFSGRKKFFLAREKNGVDATKVFVPKGQEDGKC